MLHERQSPLTIDHEAFGFNEKERLHYTISHERLQEILTDETVIISKVESRPRYFGNFQHITLSQNSHCPPQSVLFYGLGYHTQLNRWYHQTWFWHPEPLARNFPEETLSRNSLQEVLDRRRRVCILPHLEAYIEQKQKELSDLLTELKRDSDNIDIQHKVLKIIDDLSA